MTRMHTEGCLSDIFLPIAAATENPFKPILTELPNPSGGSYGKFYSLPALNDPRIGT